MKLLIDRFEEKVKITPTCHLWIGHMKSFGYGGIRIKNKILRVHRVAWELYKGPIPNGLCVLHTCDVRNCVNPDHLFLGTKSDNNKDRARKKRTVNKKGEDHHNSKLSNNDVIEIQHSEKKRKEIAEQYGISKATVDRIRHNRAWKHVLR